MSTQSTGRLGEDLAVSYLKDKGYFILDRNYHTKFGEIDIVATKGNTIIFYEVKYRTNATFGFPDEAIHPAKREKIRKSIEVWITKKGHEISFEDIYFNAIIILPDRTIEELEL
jgi:putative endonuclease